MCTLPYACILTCTRAPNRWFVKGQTYGTPTPGAQAVCLVSTLSTRFLWNVAGKTLGKSGSLRFESPLFWLKKCVFFDSPNWIYQRRPMGKLRYVCKYKIRKYYIQYNTILYQVDYLYIYINISVSPNLWASPQVWAVVLKTPSNRKICPFLTKTNGTHGIPLNLT
jgi:hypothetical protein